MHIYKSTMHLFAWSSMSSSPLEFNLVLIFVFLRTAHPRMRMNVLFFSSCVMIFDSYVESLKQRLANYEKLLHQVPFLLLAFYFASQSSSAGSARRSHNSVGPKLDSRAIGCFSPPFTPKR